MTCNLTQSALGGSANATNREYLIADTHSPYAGREADTVGPIAVQRAAQVGPAMQSARSIS
jgi:hypothetical protein